MRNVSSAVLLFTCFWAAAGVAPAQGLGAKVRIASAAFEPDEVEPGGRTELVITLQIEPGWHVYSVAPSDVATPTSFTIETPGLTVDGEIKEPAPHLKEEDWGTYGYHEGAPTFRVPVKVAEDPRGTLRVRGRVGYQACDESGCLTPTSIDFRATLTCEPKGDESPGGNGDAAPPAAGLGKVLEALAEVKSGIADLGTLEGDLADLRSRVDELLPKEAPPAPPPPAWSLGRPRLEVLSEGIRADESARVRLTFETPEKAHVESPEDVFVDFGQSDRVEDIEAVSVESSEDGLTHTIELEVRAKTLARSGAEHLELGISIPFDDEGYSFEKEVAGVPLDLEFGLPSTWAWILKAVAAALLALLTPCVFPMIPVTVSYFTKQAEAAHTRPLVLPTVYVAGIVVSFVAIGTIFTSVAGAAGPQFLATNGYVQGLFGVLFVLFSLSLFGLFTLRPPSFLMAKAGSVQGKGGLVGTLGMGLLFSLTSFTCTAPLVGLILVDAAESGEWQFPIIGMFAFSLVLALPFFFLALFPRLLSSMPKSGGWLNSVKVTLGFLELAFAFKFIGAMDAAFGWGVFTRTSILWMWAVMFIMNGIYLLGLIRFAHDGPIEKVGPWAGAVAVALILLGLHLQGGAQGSTMPYLVESLMPPALDHQGGEGLGWNDRIDNDPEAAWARARELGAPVFVDFTGYT